MVPPTLKAPRAPSSSKTYCPSCGTLVPEGVENCPVCGMRVRTKAAKQLKPEKIEAGGGIEDATDKTEAGSSSKKGAAAKKGTAAKKGVAAKLESAIPAENEIKDPYHHENPMHLKSVLVASFAALLVLGSAILLITHPWDPHAFDTRATTPADLSQEYVPDQVDALKGQDSGNADSGEIESGDEAMYKKFNETYKKFGEYSKSLESSTSDLEKFGFTGDAKAVTEGKNSANQLDIDIPNLISEIQSTDVSSGKYYSQQQDLIKMGNYLRNEADILLTAWKKAEQSTNPATEKSSILQPVKTSGANYANLFSEAYAAFSISAP